MKNSPGKRFRKAMADEFPLQVMGTINAYVALMAKKVGFHALYLSGAGVANSSYGLPDLGMTTLDNVLEDTQRITEAVDLPLLVDIDIGWGNALMIQRTIRKMIQAGAAGVHIEDQALKRRCGHRPGKEIVSKKEMVDRVKAAVDAKTDPNFIIMARTDAFAIEGMDSAIDRAIAYRDAGADMLFPEALHSLAEFKQFKQAVEVPILANITEFGKTPLFTPEELGKVGVDIVLYPLSVNRVMNLSARQALKEIRSKGTQRHLLHRMQTRDELYDFLDYHSYEQSQ